MTAAFGVVLAALASRATRMEDFLADLETAIQGLAATRPTAVNLFWALDRMRRHAGGQRAASIAALRASLVAEAEAILEEDVASNRRLGAHGAALVPEGARILTHCNAGGLATAGYGTALGIVRGAVEEGKRLFVWVDETRPVLQGARLTAWELAKEGIPHTVIADVAAASLMARGEIDLVVVGADRIAANGDTANKIGTYGLAVLAGAHRLPFYVAAPFTTIDPSIPDGKGIPIEERDAREVQELAGRRIVPAGLARAEPGLRRHAGGPHHGHRHRARHLPPALSLRGGLGRPPRCPPAEGAGEARARSGTPRPRGQGLSAVLKPVPRDG